ncbi:uncharacterized membrane protein At3g27390-like isoform X2 [Punica granatum]|uniref:Uncharacterized membrane protein At3g27390-like isoform X2 n=1 Tax=Punica granatum TaxID=22663 RepID=A0A6P8CW18_PUNGR|nr:uncharacterized membrane protein At3g27390-like isoform X2 [Punica granatum]
MEVPGGFLAKSWSFLSFLPFFFLLFLLGLLKAAVIGPVVVCIIGAGNSAVAVGMWLAHVVWTYFCVARTKRLGLILKVLVLLLLPVPLVLWPVVGILGSLLGAVGYGVFAPVIATFEAVGENVTDKFYHCFADGFWSTIEGSCTVVRDFTDFCFHSYFSFMDELRENLPANEKPVDVKLSKLPSCLLASTVGILVDVMPITGIALWKSPYMLFRGWKRLLEDLIGREGPFLETVCVPFAGLAILLWPLAVVGAVLASFISSFFLGLYSGVIVHQEDSFLMGLAYIIAIVSMFDEYVNDMLYLREGSCLPRPVYNRNLKPGVEKEGGGSTDRNEFKSIQREGSLNAILPSQQSRTLKWKIQQYKPVQVWDWLFKSCEVNGRIFLRQGLIDNKDIEECIVRGNCKKLGIKLPAWTILQCLLASAKLNSSGLLISDDVELTRMNSPRDRVFEWFLGPLLIMKEQIKGLGLSEDEEMCLRKIVMRYKNEKPEDWDDTGFPFRDNIRRAQLQAIIRRGKIPGGRNWISQIFNHTAINCMSVTVTGRLGFIFSKILSQLVINLSSYVLDYREW